MGSPMNLKISEAKKIKLETNHQGYDESEEKSPVLDLKKNSNHAGE